MNIENFGFTLKMQIVRYFLRNTFVFKFIISFYLERSIFFRKWAEQGPAKAYWGLLRQPSNLVHFILYSSACSFHAVFVSMFISYCIHYYFYFTLYSSACKFQTAFVSMFILCCFHQDVHFKLHSSACSFQTAFVSILISYYTHELVHFIPYSPVCSFHTVSSACIFIIYWSACSFYLYSLAF